MKAEFAAATGGNYESIEPKKFRFPETVPRPARNADVAVGRGVSQSSRQYPPLDSLGERTTMVWWSSSGNAAFRLQRTGSRPRSSATWGNTSRTGSRGRLSPRNNCSRSRRSSRKGNTSALRRGPNSRPPFTSPRPRWEIWCSTSFFFSLLLLFLLKYNDIYINFEYVFIGQQAYCWGSFVNLFRIEELRKKNYYSVVALNYSIFLFVPPCISYKSIWLDAKRARKRSNVSIWCMPTIKKYQALFSVLSLSN